MTHGPWRREHPGASRSVRRRVASGLLLAVLTTWAVDGWALPVVNRVRSLGIAQVKSSTATSLQVTLGGGATAAVNDRVVVAFATDDVAGEKITVTDSRGNAYGADADVVNTGHVRTLVFSARSLLLNAFPSEFMTEQRR